MLIFDSFPTLDHAERFAAAVAQVEPELSTRIYTDAGEAFTADPIPVQLVAPVVHVERPYSGHDPEIESARQGGFADDTSTGAEREQALELAVIPYLGKYVGT